MRAVEQLVERHHESKIGNHRSLVVRRGTERHFVYFQTVICVAEDTKLQFMLDNGGYWTSSTKKALLAYRKEFFDRGYTEKLEAKIQKKKRDGTFEAVDQIGVSWILAQEDFPDHNLAKGFKFVAHAKYGRIQEIRFILEEVEVSA